MIEEQESRWQIVNPGLPGKWPLYWHVWCKSINVCVVFWV